MSHGQLVWTFAFFHIVKLFYASAEHDFWAMWAISPFAKWFLIYSIVMFSFIAFSTILVRYFQCLLLQRSQKASVGGNGLMTLRLNIIYSYDGELPLGLSIFLLSEYAFRCKHVTYICMWMVKNLSNLYGCTCSLNSPLYADVRINWPVVMLIYAGNICI